MVSIQQADHESIHLAQHDALVGQDVSFHHVVVTSAEGCPAATNVRYAGPGGDAELLGVYFAESGQHHENRLFVDHEATHCKSNVIYMGALAGDNAWSVWIGDVLIRAAAEGTNTFELNRNLVLTDGARADSVPNLEIETGEIEGAPATRRRPAGSTTSSCSTCRPAASRGRGPAAGRVRLLQTSSARSASPRSPTTRTT